MMLFSNATESEKKLYWNIKRCELIDKTPVAVLSCKISCLNDLRHLPAKTQDGKEISLFSNVGLGKDIHDALKVGTDGIGLFRSEVSFMNRDEFPSEEEQRVIYAQILKAFNPKPVMVRTLDIGGDKSLSYFKKNETTKK